MQNKKRILPPSKSLYARSHNFYVLELNKLVWILNKCLFFHEKNYSFLKSSQFYHNHYLKTKISAHDPKTIK